MNRFPPSSYLPSTIYFLQKAGGKDLVTYDLPRIEKRDRKDCMNYGINSITLFQFKEGAFRM